MSKRKPSSLDYECPRKFVPDSTLRGYLEDHEPYGGYEEGCETCLLDVVCSLRNIINEKKLYDKNNPHVILCDSDLEAALNCPALGRYELADKVCYQLKKCEKEGECEAQTVISKKFGLITKDSRFGITRAFRAVLKTLPEFDKKKHVHRYGQLAKHLSAYIMKNTHLVDERNVKICIVKNDILGKAFNVEAFHRDQTSTFLRKQLTLIL